MTPSDAIPFRTVRPATRRASLLVGSALCGMAAMMAQPALAGTLPGIPGAGSITVSAGGSQPVITAPDAVSLQVDLNAPRTVINWSSFHVSNGDTVNFQFDAASDIVLNKTTSQIQIDNGGAVTGKVGAATGGEIWFYSPQGVIVSPGAAMSAGGFVFAGGSGLSDANFVNAGNPESALLAASNALIRTTTFSPATSASINAAGDVVLSASSGNLSASTVYGKTAQMSTTNGSITVSEITATTGAASVHAGTSANVAQITGATGATVSSANLSSVGSATTTSGDIVITSNGSAELTLGNSARDLTLSGPQVSLHTADAKRSVYVTGTTQASVASRIFAGDDIEVTAGGAVAAGSATLKSTGLGASNDAHVLARSTAGTVNVGSAITQGTGAAAGDVTISAFSTATLGSGASTGDLTVTGAGLLSLTGAYSATGTIALTSSNGAIAQGGGSITAGLLSASAPLGVTLNQATNNVVNLGSINGGTGGFSYYDQDSFGLTGAITTTGVVSLTSGSGSIIQTGGTISADTLNVQAETGISLDKANTVAKLGDLLNYTSGDISFHDADGFVLNGGVDAVGSVSLFADNGDITHLSGNLHGYGAVSLEAAGRIILGDIGTDGDFSATAAGDVYINELQSGGDILVKSTGGSATLRSAVLNGVTPGHDLTVSASGDATLGANDEAGITSSHWFVRGTSTGVSTVRSTSGSASVYLDNSAAIDTVEAGADANVVVKNGPLSLGAVTASAGNVYVTAGDGALSIGSASASGDLYVKALDGALTVGAASAGDYLELYSDGGGPLQVSGAVQGDGVHIAGQGLVNLTSTSSIDSGGEVLLGGDTMTIAGSVRGDRSVQVSTTGLLDASAAPLIFSGYHLTILAGSAAAGPLKADGRITVGALTGNVDLASAHAGQEVVVVSANGDATVGSAESDSATVSVQASGDVRVGLAKANGVNGTVDVGGAGDVTLRGGEATQGILVHARDGTATFGADNKASITAANYAVTAAAVGCSCAPDTNGLQVISDFGDAVVNVNSLSNPIAVVGGGVDHNTIVTLKTGNLTIDGLAGYNITVEVENGAFSAGNVVTAGGDYTITAHDFLDHALRPTLYFGAIRDVTITDTQGDLDLGAVDLHADRNLRVTATNGAVLGAGGLEAGTGALTLNAATNVGLQGVLTADTLNVTSGTGVVLLGANRVARLGAIDVAAGGLTFHGADAFQVSGPINAAGQMVDLRSDHAISQASGGVITAQTLTGSSVGGADFGAANQVVQLGGFTNTGGLLRLVNARSLAVTGAVLSTGTVSLASHGGMTIASAGSVRGDAAGDAVVLASDGVFTNARGADAVVAGDTAGRWLIYTQAVGAPLGSTSGNSFNGLSGKSFYGAAYDFSGGTFARSINAGNRFVYAYQPVLTVTPSGQTMVYDGTTPTVSTTITGLVNGDLAGDAWSGLATVSGAGKNAGTHVLTAGAGSLASDLNYGFTYGTGTLNVLKRQVTVTADNLSKTSGYLEPTLTYRVTAGDLVAGDAFTGGLARAGGESFGPHAITQGTLALSSNYDLTFVGAVLTIDPVPTNERDGSSALKRLTQSPDFTLDWDPQAHLATEGQAPSAGGAQ